jgi:hypothetical protein
VAIIQQNGRPRSVSTPEEAVKDAMDQFASLSPDEQDAFLELMGQIDGGEFGDLRQIIDVEYDRVPVDPMQFLEDEYYLGASGNSMWPQLKKDFVELFGGGYSEAILGGSLGWGKSFFATCAIAYILYQMSCLRNPQSAYGLAPGSKIVVPLMSVTREVARRVPFTELKSKLEQSPYFKEVCKFKAADTMYEMRFEKRIMVIAGSLVTSAIGGNVFSGFIDELSFFRRDWKAEASGKVTAVDRGEQIRDAIVRRMKSRFQKVGKLPGILFLVSSKERPTAFVEKRIEQVRAEQDSATFIREYANYDVKPRDTFSEKTFFVVVGNDKVRSKLDPSEAERAMYAGMGLTIIEVPIDFRSDFERNIESSIRDIAGIATESVSLFITRTEKISEAEKRDVLTPVDVEHWVCGSVLQMFWERVARKETRYIPGGVTEEVWVPLRHPDAPRHVHIDPALSGDSAGMAIGHIAGWVQVQRRDKSGTMFYDVAPVIESDLLLEIEPPMGEEIFLADLRSIVYQFAAHGFSIAFASMDSYQSADMRQQLEANGIESEVLSVDKTEVPYEVLKTAYYEGRMRIQEHATLRKELSQLQRVPAWRQMTGVIRFKIDHPEQGSKDVADALAGMTYSLTTRTPGRPMPFIPAARVGGGEKNDHSWVLDGAVPVSSIPVRRSGGGGGMMPRGGDEPSMPPFVRG